MILRITQKGENFLTAVQYAKTIVTEGSMRTAEMLAEWNYLDNTRLPEYLSIRDKYCLHMLRARDFIELVPENIDDESGLVLVDSYKRMTESVNKKKKKIEKKNETIEKENGK